MDSVNTSSQLSFIREMMGNDEKLVTRFINIFKSQCPQQLQELKVHYTNQDWAALSIVAHSMKTQFRYLSLEALATQASKIETMADQGETDQIGELIVAFEKDIDNFIKALS